MKVKLLHPDAIAPTRATEGAAGYDLYSCESLIIPPMPFVGVICTGVAVEIPRSMVGLILGRSSLAGEGIDVLGGVIDSDYRGELKVVVGRITGGCLYYVSKGLRIAQLVIVPCLQEPVEVATELSETARSKGGFGSTGK